MKMRTLYLLISLIFMLYVFVSPVYAGKLTNSLNDIDQFSSITDSEELIDVPVVTGKVYQEDGKTEAAYATMVLFAWPNDDDLVDLEEGDSINRIPIGITTTNKSGYYQLRIDPKVDSRNCWSKAGYLNCEIFTLTDTGFKATFFSIKKIDALALDITKSDDTAYANSNNGEILIGMKTNIEIVPRINDKEASTLIYGTLIEVYSPAWVNVGNILNLGNPGNYTEQFIYQAGATSTIVVGISSTGQYGTFSKSGTITKSSTATIGFPSYSSVTTRFMDTQFTFAKYLCNFYGIPYYAVQAYQFVGGTQTSRICEYPENQTYRSIYSPGAFFIKQTNIATTWETGAKVSFLIGIDLSARCGYTSNSKLEFHFITTGYLYGESGYPPVTNGRVWVKCW
jgi:hypothetical protein